MCLSEEATTKAETIKTRHPRLMYESLRKQSIPLFAEELKFLAGSEWQREKMIDTRQP